MAQRTEPTDTSLIPGEPSALGWAALAVTTALLSAYFAGHLHAGALVFVGMALCYGGLAQFVAGMWAFAQRNTFLATVFSSFGAFWMGLGILAVVDRLGHLGMPLFTGDGITWFWFCWAILATTMWLASFRTTGAVWLVLALWAATFWALWIGQLLGNSPGTGWTAIGGYLGWATAVVAGYTSCAELINHTFGTVVLPELPSARLHALPR